MLCRYQIRAKRIARGRLVTVQALKENMIALLMEEAAFTADKMVNDVFNFFRWVNVR